MNVFLWIVAALLSVIFLASGLMKLIRSKDQLAVSGQAWAEDFSARAIRTIGVLEVLAAIGLILPPILGIASVLAPLAALGLVLVMLGAVITHLRRHEPLPVAVNIAFLAMAAVVFWGRIGPESFNAEHSAEGSRLAEPLKPPAAASRCSKPCWAWASSPAILVPHCGAHAPPATPPKRKPEHHQRPTNLDDTKANERTPSARRRNGGPTVSDRRQPVSPKGRSQ